MGLGGGGKGWEKGFVPPRVLPNSPGLTTYVYCKNKNKKSYSVRIIHRRKRKKKDLPYCYRVKSTPHFPNSTQRPSPAGREGGRGGRGGGKAVFSYPGPILGLIKKLVICSKSSSHTPTTRFSLLFSCRLGWREGKKRGEFLFFSLFIFLTYMS